MDYKIIIGFVFFTILISIQYTLNRILAELKEIRKNQIRNYFKDSDN